ncbi:NYN domain-containing protein [Piscinibacter lacus]|uniref:NYN domain-containing protein n=1 Tax=Aquariibacter lacus TaxID=2801332 RepID=UPI00257385D0|nr:NYN domain-containing protein [Piscinibacter lacus]
MNLHPPSGLPREARIALLIDADNSPAAKIDVILAELAKHGVSNIRRAYGNWKKQELKGWEAVLHEYAIRPVQQFDVSKGKNATDMVMTIEALELLYTDRPEAFGIVSSDADFTPLVMHLRAKGALVFGFGAKKTPAPFVNACSRFLFLENLGAPAVLDEPEPSPAPAARPAGKKAAAKKAPARKTALPAASPAPTLASDESEAELPPQVAAMVDSLSAAPAATPARAAGPLRLDRAALKQDARLVSLLRNAVESAEGEDGWSPLGAVGQQIGNQASFDPRNYGYRKLIDLIEATQLFDLERRGSQFLLRDKRRSRPRA